MNIVNIGIGLDIAAPVIMMIFIITGAVKAWPYRKTDRERFITIYKPFKYWGLGIWLVLNIIGMLLIFNA